MVNKNESIRSPEEPQRLVDATSLGSKNEPTGIGDVAMEEAFLKDEKAGRFDRMRDLVTQTDPDIINTNWIKLNDVALWGIINRHYRGPDGVINWEFVMQRLGIGDKFVYRKHNDWEKGGISEATKKLSELLELRAKTTETLNPEWIRQQDPKLYDYLSRILPHEKRQVRWDQLFSQLDPKWQKIWRIDESKRLSLDRRLPENLYSDKRAQKELDSLLEKKQDHLYTFTSDVKDSHERREREEITLSLIEMAQNGNELAARKLVELSWWMIEGWALNREDMADALDYKEDLNDVIYKTVFYYDRKAEGKFFTYLRASVDGWLRHNRKIVVSSDEDHRKDKNNY